MGSKKGKASKAYSIRVSESALRHVDEITAYIAIIKHQPLNAIRVGDKIFETIDRIQQNPFAFRECNEIPTKTKMYRKAVCMSWLIIYRIRSIEVVILGVIHRSRRESKIRKLRIVK